MTCSASRRRESFTTPGADQLSTEPAATLLGVLRPSSSSI